MGSGFEFDDFRILGIYVGFLAIFFQEINILELIF